MRARNLFLTFFAAGAGLAIVLAGGASLNARRALATSTFCATRALQPTDFAYLGAMRVPATGSSWDMHPGGGALSGRVVNGHVHIFLTGGVQGYIGEFLDTETYDRDYTRAPRMQQIANYGTYNSLRQTYINPATGKNDGQLHPINSVYTRSLYWSEANQLLYFTFVNPYNVSIFPDPMLGALQLDPAASRYSNGYGPWALTAKGAPGAQHGFILYGQLPDGSVGIGGAHASGDSATSWGPELYGGLVLPNATSPQGPTVIGPDAPDIYVRYDYGGSALKHDGSIKAGAVFQPLRRTPATYNFSEPSPQSPAWPWLNPNLNGGVGSWTSVDDVWGGAWIDLADKQGVLFVGSRGENNIWYGAANDMSPGEACGTDTQGPHASKYVPRFWIYDPADLVRVKTGVLKPWEVRPASEFDPSVAIARLQLACGGGSQNNFRGAYFNRGTRTLYLSADQADPSVPGLYNHLIHVFRIN